MTDTDQRQVEAILARFPGPVRLTPSAKKWLLFVAGSLAFLAVICSSLLRDGGGSLYAITGWLLIAIFAITIVGAIGNLVPGVASLTLDADGFQTKTLFGGRKVSWKIVSNFRTVGTNISRRVAYDVDTNEPPRSALFNYLINRQRTLADNYGIPHDELAGLMTQWRAKALGE